VLFSIGDTSGRLHAIGQCSEVCSLTAPCSRTCYDGAIKGYFRQHGVPLEAAVTLQPGHASRLKVSGTPTLILVDRNGSVLGVWIGKLKPEAESAVLSAVTGSMSTVGASE
jgi:hypothetical protein